MPDTDSTSGPARPWWASEGTRWLIVTLLIPFTGFVWNEVQKHEVERQKQLERVRADEQARVVNARSESDIVIRLLPALASGDEVSPMRGVALAVLLNLANRQALSLELVSAVQVAVDTAQHRVREGKATEAERVALGKIASATDRPSTGSAPAPPPVGSGGGATTPVQAFRVQVPRVYIQIYDEEDRERARGLQNFIVDKQRWLAPGIENVVATAARTNRKPPEGTSSWRVVYFNDEDQPRAAELAGQVRAIGAERVDVQRSTVKAPSGQMEIWSPRRS